MAGLFIAYNCAFDATTGVSAGTSYASGAKCALQLVPISTGQIRLVEWGISFNGSAAGTPSTVTLAKAGAASTMSTSLSGLVLPISDNQKSSSLSMGTSASGYGNGAITTNTTAKQFDMQFVQQAGTYLKQWPLGREPVILGSEILQLRVNTATTLSAFAWIVFEEN